MLKACRRLFLLTIFALPLSGCLYEPDHFTNNRVQVEEKTYSETVSVANLDGNAVAAMAKNYRNHANGPLELAVTYDPQGESSAMKAADEAARIAGLLRQHGVNKIETNILPVSEPGHEMKALVSYSAVNALPPKDCEVMPGLNTRIMENKEEYKLGCTVENMYARQIARPRDLMGGEAIDDTYDGRRASNVLDVYRTGAPNEPLEGQGASEE